MISKGQWPVDHLTQGFGWFTAGLSGSPSDAAGQNTTVRLNYSNDTANLNQRGSLPRQAYSRAGVTNGSFGWFAGGRTGPSGPSIIFANKVDRIQFSNDTVNAESRSTGNNRRKNHSGVNNSSAAF